MKFKNLAVQMAERGYSVSAWGRSRGLSDNDIYILRELCKNAMKGVWGRGAEIRKMLESEGFKFNLKANRKKSKFVNLNSGENLGFGDCHDFANAKSSNDKADNDEILRYAQNDGCGLAQNDEKTALNDGDSAVSRAVGGF